MYIVSRFSGCVLFNSIRCEISTSCLQRRERRKEEGGRRKEEKERAGAGAEGAEGAEGTGAGSAAFSPPSFSTSALDPFVTALQLPGIPYYVG